MFDTINVDMMKNDVYALDFVLHLKTCHAEMCMLAFGPTAEHNLTKDLTQSSLNSKPIKVKSSASPKSSVRSGVAPAPFKSCATGSQSAVNSVEYKSRFRSSKSCTHSQSRE